jgi:hypothetical protein
MSFAYYGPMVIPGLALIIAFTIDRAGYRFRALLPRAALCWTIIFFQAQAKFQEPYDWMQWPELGVPAANYESKFPQLRGLRVSQSTGVLVDHIAEVIRARTSPGETLLVYPYFPIFYSLTGLRHNTYTYSHYLDVTPDAISRRDAETLLRNPPRVIVRMLLSDSFLRMDEDLFRGGKRSGGRVIEATLDAISPQYQLVETDEIPFTRQKLQVLIRLSADAHNFSQ